MKTIEEKEFNDKIEQIELEELMYDEFYELISEAKNIGIRIGRNNATRWRDPKEEMPEKYYDVLVKIECETAGVFYLIGYTVEDNTWRLYYGDGINMESAGRTIIGWREIIEP